MNFANNIVGPDFELADLILFDFGDVELTLRLPEHRSNTEKHLATQNLCNIEEDKWVADYAGNKTYLLVNQTWLYENATTLDDVFSTNLIMVLMQIPPQVRKKSIPLNKSAFASWIIDLLKGCVFDMESITPDDELAAESIKEWQVPEQVSDMQQIQRGNVDWFVASLGHTSIGLPDPMIFVPINNQYALTITISSAKLSYSDREDTFPKEDIEPVKRQIMTELLNHLQITYSPEVLQQIEEQNTLAV